MKKLRQYLLFYSIIIPLYIELVCVRTENLYLRLKYRVRTGKWYEGAKNPHRTA